MKDPIVLFLPYHNLQLVFRYPVMEMVQVSHMAVSRTRKVQTEKFSSNIYCSKSCNDFLNSLKIKR